MSLEIKDSLNPKDADYFKILQEQIPELKGWAHFVLPQRFNNRTRQTRCDTKDCGKLLRIDQIKVFITPAPEYKPFIYCRQCLEREYAKVVGSMQYDLHLRYLPKAPKK